MRRGFAWLIACLAPYALAQDSPAFEVASVKPAEPTPAGGLTVWMKGGPGSNDPTRIDFHNTSLSDLIASAYGAEYYQLVGPDWLISERYLITAKLPPGTNEGRFQMMLRNLLADRFKLQAHRDQKEMARYTLTVAKGGSKLKPHVKTPSEDNSGADIVDGRVHLRETKSVESLAQMLAAQLRAPVHDDTGLTGTYDIELSWSMRPPDSGDTTPDLITAVQEQLGLKLERKKGPVDVIVIDHVERVPTGN